MSGTEAIGRAQTTNETFPESSIRSAQRAARAMGVPTRFIVLVLPIPRADAFSEKVANLSVSYGTLSVAETVECRRASAPGGGVRVNRGAGRDAALVGLPERVLYARGTLRVQ